jgi:hypothetical protein
MFSARLLWPLLSLSIVMDDHLLQDAIPRSGIEEDAHERKRALI